MTTLMHFLLWEEILGYRSWYVSLYIDKKYQSIDDIDFIWGFIDN